VQEQERSTLRVLFLTFHVLRDLTLKKAAARRTLYHKELLSVLSSRQRLV
jgi:hypothetical protein